MKQLWLFVIGEVLTIYKEKYMGKGQEKTNKNNKQKLTTKEKQEKKKAKKEGKK